MGAAGEAKTNSCTPAHGRVSFGQPAKTFSHQLCMDTRCNLEDLTGAMDDLNG